MVVLEVRPNTGIAVQEEADQVQEAVIESLAACIGKLRNEEKSMVKIDMKKVQELCDVITDAATYKRIALLPNIQNQFDLSFQILEEFQRGSKHFEQLLNIIDKTECDCEVDYFSVMLNTMRGVKKNG
jgi:hypothetical protein